MVEVVDEQSQKQLWEDVYEDGDDIKHPEVSVIIPVHNGLEMSTACVDSIYANTKNIDFEIIILDNASEDETPVWLDSMQRTYDNLRSMRMAKNVGFGPAVNKGIQESWGRYLVILNNDTLVSKNWLKNLIEIMDSDPSIGIVSPITNYVGEGPQIDGDAQRIRADPEQISEYAERIASRSQVIYEPNRLVFFCVLIRREVVDLVGYLDEGYIQGNFEDDDYCLRTRMAGYRLAVATNSFVYHHGSATFKESHISHRQWMEVNRSRFYEKVGRIATIVQPRGSSSWEDKDGVSVIIRTKDRPGLLKNALTSLTNQTISNFEVVIVNDGGEDIFSQIQFFESYFPLVYVFHNEPKGRASAINEGVIAARGEWIAFLDDDDILYPWHLETLLRAAETSGTKFVYSDFNRALFANANSFFPIRLIGAPPWEYSQKELLVQNFIPIHTWIHRRECYQEVGPWDEKLDRLEDYEYLLRLSSLYEFKHVRKVTCEYRYYLDVASSITSGRKKYIDALRSIYHKFPVDDSELIRERKSVQDRINIQVDTIRELMGSLKGSPGNVAQVNREIIRLVAGL
jgi:GT2 family glycosyltransferase